MFGSDLQLPGDLHVVVVGEDVGDEALSAFGEGGRSLGDARLHDHVQQRVRTPGPVPHLKGETVRVRGRERWSTFIQMLAFW